MRKATLNAPLPGAPATNDLFDLFIDCFRLKQFVLKGECSVATMTQLVQVMLLDYPPQSAGVPPTRASILYADQSVSLIVDSNFTQYMPSESAYSHSTAYLVACDGALGAKLLLPSLIGGTWSFWAGAS